MIRRAYIPIFLLALSSSVFAQITANDRKEVIDSLSKVMIERYVVKTKAEEVAKTIKANLASGAYDSLSDGKEFAAKLAADANAICRDAHFRIRYSDSVLPVRKDATEPSKSELDAQEKFERQVNYGFEEVKRLNGNVGYIHFRGFMDPQKAARAIQASMQFVQDTDALIFDIRDNGGGDPETVKNICSYLFDKPTHINDILFREGDKTRRQEYRTGKAKGSVYTKPIYVLVSKRTGSGAEEFAYDLQTQKRATIIGENTWGGANPGGNVRLTDHFMAFIPGGMAQNPITKTNWEGVGVTPDVKCDPQNGLKEAHTMALNKLLETATGDDRTRLTEALKMVGS
ncbi:MAG: S41 family peptidase [Armatimonadetes bacterium]|nr:S41 family peptidase [Armatimonadota bacterium]MBS1726133.1 S41 family peptidase [Armatimonadota bacterium]